MSVCLCVTFSFSNRFSSFFFVVLLILHWSNMYFPPNNILYQIASSFYFSVIPFLPRPNISILQMFSFFQCFPVFYFSISFTIFDQIFSFSVFLFICWPNIILLSIFLLKYFTRSSHSSPKIEEEKNEYAPKFHSDDFPILHNYFNFCRS